jgi:hypothetical protein
MGAMATHWSMLIDRYDTSAPHRCCFAVLCDGWLPLAHGQLGRNVPVLTLSIIQG